MKLPHPLRGIRRHIRRPAGSLLRDPRVALLGVPLAAGVLLMTSNHGARPVPVAATATTTTVKLEDVGDPVLPDAEVGGDATTSAEGPIDDGNSGGSGSGGFSGGSDGGGGSGYGGGSDFGGGSPVSNPAGGQPTVSVRSATTIQPGVVVPTTVGPIPTTTTPRPPGAVVDEAASPAVMAVVGVGVAGLAFNGAVWIRRRRGPGRKQ